MRSAWNAVIKIMFKVMDERQKVSQEHINRKVFIDWIRILGLPNSQRKKFDVLLEEFAKKDTRVSKQNLSKK